MNEDTIVKLLAEDESIFLEFKSDLDLNSKFGKAKFLREVLSLANSPIKQGYLLLGVEDKTKKVIGVGDITEEQVQQIVSDWCRPSINFDFWIVENQGSTVGVMKIYPVHPPYTLKKKLGFDEPSGNKKRIQGEIRTNQVFIRRGSIIAEAEIDEVIEMAQRDTLDLGDVVAGLDKMSGWLKEIAYNSNDHHFAPTRDDETNENLETTFVALITGLILGWIITPVASWVSYISLPLFFILAVVFSAIKLTHFNIRHALVASAIVGIPIGFWFSYQTQFLLAGNLSNVSLVLGVIMNGFVSSVIGLIASVVLMFWRPFDEWFR